jgi:hypothetical protein
LIYLRMLLPVGTHRYDAVKDYPLQLVLLKEEKREWQEFSTWVIWIHHQKVTGSSDFIERAEKKTHYQKNTESAIWTPDA